MKKKNIIANYENISLSSMLKIYWNSSKFHWKMYRNFLKNKNALFILTSARIPLNLHVTLNNYLIFIEINSNTIQKKNYQ